MLGKQHTRLARPQFGQLILQHAAHKKFFLNPDRHGRRKARQSAGRKRMVGFKQALEFQIGLVVKRDRFKIIQLKAGLLQHIARGMARKITVVLFTGKALLVRGRNDCRRPPELRQHCHDNRLISPKSLLWSRVSRF